MSDYDEGGEAPCWAHMFEDEVAGERTNVSDPTDDEAEVEVEDTE